MALFDDAWMKGFQEQWNAEPELSGALEKIGFNSVIGYGFPGDATCTGFIAVENGKVVDAGAYDGRELNWDMRADQKNWEKWLAKEVGMTGLGPPFTTASSESLAALSQASSISLGVSSISTGELRVPAYTPTRLLPPYSVLHIRSIDLSASFICV